MSRVETLVIANHLTLVAGEVVAIGIGVAAAAGAGAAAHRFNATDFIAEKTIADLVDALVNVTAQLRLAREMLHA